MKRKIAEKRRSGSLRETRTIFLNGLFLKNPVLIGALGLYPVVAAGYNLRMAVQLSLLMFFISLPAGLVFCLAGEFLAGWLRPGAVLIVSAACYLPAAWLVNQLFPGSLNTMGIFAGLIICNSMVLSRCNDYAPAHLLRAVLADILGCVLGYSLVLCAVACLREYLQRGSVWNSSTGIYIPADKGTALPFFGFIMLGFLAALVQGINLRREKKSGRGAPRA